MKRMLCLLLLISLLCSVVAVFTACNSDGGEVDNSCCKNPVERKRLEERIEPTCVDAGSYILVTYCETCSTESKRESVIVPATGRHIAGEKKRENEEVVNCILSYDDVARCICCDIEMVRTHITEEAKHTAGEPQRIEGAESTCTSAGYYYVDTTCADCGHLLNRESFVTAVEAHTPNSAVKENEKLVNCVHSYDNVVYCADCETELSRTNITEKPNHTAGAPIKQNEKTVRCVKTYDEVVCCKDCGIELSRKQISQAVEHTPGEEREIVHSEPDCYTEGVVFYDVYCEECEIILSRKVGSIPNYGHCAGEPQGTVVKAPTCESFGLYCISVYCTECGELLDELTSLIDPTGHEYKDRYCIYCGDIEGDVHYADVYWDQTDNFIFSLTENSNNQELPSTCARYLAGNLERGLPPGERPEYIDDLVTIRNDDAINITKVRPLYNYLPDDMSHGWGGNIKDMVDDMSTYVEGITPDVYCNFVYDMVNASLSGAFANLKSSTIKTDGSTQKNWFRFTNPTFVDTGDGYMVEYMRSLSLSRNKQYCLASDYFTDAIRAFMVVPVNIQLLKTLPLSNVEGAFNYDYIADGEYTIEDFYEFVYTGKWSYATLAEISDVYNFYVDDGAQATDNSNGDLNDRLVFAISESSGLSASGMLYSTSVTVIERQLATFTDWAGNQYTDYEYFYPSSDEDPNKDKPGYVPSNQSLYKFCDALTSLMSEHKGIISISNAQDCGYYPGNALLAIRNRFVNNRILFGGVVMLGSLEYVEYSYMSDGFGIVPVPLYEVYDDIGMQNSYNTQIHNIGRVGAINARTTNFAKISAYLDYVSMNSTEILEEYYETKLCGDVAGGGAHKEMLIYIRGNVRTSFDKVFEDAIGYLLIKDSSNVADATLTSEQQKWHALIMSGKFKLDSSDMEQAYNTYVKTKADRLNAIEASYVGLPS